MRYLYAIALLALLLLPKSLYARDLYEAVCRISATIGRETGTGTGTVFSKNGQVAHILTNAHVVDRAKVVSVEFWREGHPSPKVNGRVIWRQMAQHYRDMAIVEVGLDIVQPHVIPLADRGSDIASGGTIMSIGCAKGAWPTSWRGHNIRIQGPVYEFVPSPLGGRSGSAILDANGTNIVGLIAWNAGSHGLAMTLEEIYRAFESKPPTRSHVQYNNVVQLQFGISDSCVHGVSLLAYCNQCELMNPQLVPVVPNTQHICPPGGN